MRKLKATRTRYEAGTSWSAIAEIDSDKVEALRAHIRAGGKVPPVVVVQYSAHLMPLDGHHRMSAWDAEGLPYDTYSVKGPAFENLDILARDQDEPSRAEDHVLCDGVPAMQVAEMWSRRKELTDVA